MIANHMEKVMEHDMETGSLVAYAFGSTVFKCTKVMQEFEHQQSESFC